MTTKEKLQSLAQNSIVLDISEELEDYKQASLAVFYVKLYKYLICIRG